MKKRMMAILCVLTVLLGILAATAAAADTTDKIEVGYAKKDINPWVDVDNHSKGVMAVPLAGYNNPLSRLAQGRIDDNGDGEVDDKDGLFATCVAVKDSDNKLLIFISFDVTQVQDATVTEVRNRIIAELSDEYTLTPEQIMLSASHSHYTPNIAYAGSAYKNEAFYGLMVKYKEYLYSQLTLAATEAVADLKEVSKISKSTTDAGKVTGYYMNGVRHYNVTAINGESIVNYKAGDNFGSLANAGTTYGSSHPTMPGYKITSVTHVTQANDQLHLLKFAFSGGSDPVVIANWRAHTTLNRFYEGEAGVVLNPGVDRDALLDEGNGIGYYCVSSSYVNAFRYQLERMNLRVSFIQGAAGNINPDSRASNLNGWIENGWEVAMAEKAGYTDNSGFASNDHMKLYRKAVIIGNVYGELLSQVAKVGLQDPNMTECEPGKIQTMQVRYALKPNVFDGEMPGLQYAAEAYQAASSPSTPYVYTCNGQKYIINSPQHARTVVDRAKDLKAGSFAETLAKLELNAIMIGPDLAFVSAPNELYDFYDAAGSTNALDNDWLDIESNIIGGTYGTPFVMCYTNGNHGYVANSAAFEYNAGSTFFGKGSYGANSSEVAKGGGEAIIAAYGKMLKALNDGSIKTEECTHCKKEVEWKPLLAENAGNTNLYHDHYYLAEDIDSQRAREKMILAGQSICLDLNGYTICSNDADYGRAFYIYAGAELTIMDSQDGGKVVASGRKSEANYAGGVIGVASGVLNLYGGTVEQTVTTGQSATYGGAIYCSGVINMFGGTVIGGDTTEKDGDTTEKGGAIYCNSNGKFYMHNGRVEGGTAVGGGAVMNSGTTELYGGTITGGTATGSNYGHCVHVADTATLKLAGDADVEEIYFAASNCSDDLTITGKYVGTAALKYCNGVNDGMTIGISDSADLSKATLQCVDNSSLCVTVSGNVLKLTSGSQEVVAMLYVNGQETKYTNLQEAINACTDGSVVSLVKNNTDNIFIPVGRTVSLDLNSFDLCDVAVDGTFLVKDSSTDSFNTAEGEFGKITGTITGSGTIQGAPLDSEGCVYVKVVENNGISFHRLKMQIGSAGIYYNNPGMEYICDFAGDQWAAAQVVTYGVAVSVTDEPTQQNGQFASHCAATTQTDFVSGSSGNSGNSSTITGILKDSYSYQVNRNNANLVIYGKSYVKLSDGTCLLGAPVNYSFRDMFEYASDGVDAQGNSIWDNYFTDADKSNLIKIYDDFAYIMEDWSIEKLLAERDARLQNQSA